MTPQAKPRVFLSYARQDQPAVRQIYHFLLEHGCDPWLDVETLLPGQDWAYEIERAIQQTDYFLACLSNHAVDKRGYVQAELKKGLDACLMIPQGDTFLIPVDGVGIGPVSAGSPGHTDYRCASGPTALQPGGQTRAMPPGRIDPPAVHSLALR